MSVLRAPEGSKKGLIAWCPDAFMPESRAMLAAFDSVDKVEVSFAEAKKAFACNLVSTGQTAIMGAHAPAYKAALESQGFTIVTPAIHELSKGGGYIRCTTLTLDN